MSDYPHMQWDGQRWLRWDGTQWLDASTPMAEAVPEPVVPQPDPAVVVEDPSRQWDGSQWLQWDGAQWLHWDGAQWVPAAPMPPTFTGPPAQLPQPGGQVAGKAKRRPFRGCFGAGFLGLGVTLLLFVYGVVALNIWYLFGIVIVTSLLGLLLAYVVPARTRRPKATQQWTTGA